MATALATLMSMPVVPIVAGTTPVTLLTRLAAALGSDCPRVLMKRDDLLPFGLGGNKVRKLQTIAAEAMAAGADTLITCGGAQSNHARVTAATGAALGLRVDLVLNGAAPADLVGNARLDALFGATMHYVPSREARVPAMEDLAAELRRAGRKPFIVPLGGSTPTGAMGFARGISEIAGDGIKPDAIVHATSSGGTQAGLVAGCALFGVRTRVIGISADDVVEIDDTYVGGGYGVPTPASIEAQTITARTEGILLDPVYTAKAMAGLIGRIRAGAFHKDQTVLFWHTGGTPAYFA